MVGSEVYSSEVKKTEVLGESFRRAIGTSLLRDLPFLPLKAFGLLLGSVCFALLGSLGRLRSPSEGNQGSVRRRADRADADGG
jgi:hypothetical protein